MNCIKLHHLKATPALLLSTISLALLIGGATPAGAATAIFNNATPNSDYATPGNWSTGTIPGNGNNDLPSIGDAVGPRSALYSGAANYTTTSRLIVGNNAGGNGALTHSGTGTLSFGADGYGSSCDIGQNAGTGSLTLNSGAITVTTVGSAGSLRVGVNGAANGTLVINGGTLTVPGRILMSANNASSVANFTLNGGAVVLGTGTGGTGDPGNGRFWTGNGTTTARLNGGTLTLFDFNGGSANTRIYFNGATVKPRGNNTAFTAGTLTMQISTNGARLDTAGYNITFGTALLHDTALGATADGGLLKTGAGALTLSGNGGTYTGPVTISNGLVNVTASVGGTAPASSPLGAPGSVRTVTVCSNAVLYLGANDIFGNHVANPGATLVINEGGLVTNAATYNTLRNLTLNGGELRVCGGAATSWQSYQLKGIVTASGNVTSRISVAAAPVNAFNQIHIGNNVDGGVTVFDVADGTSAVDLLVSAPLVNGLNSGGIAVSSGLTKTGPGTMVMAGASLYTGATMISNGTFLVNGSLAATPVTVQPPATLGGGGVISGTVTVNGTLSPGTSIGTLAVANTVTLNGNTLMELQKSGSTLTNDRLAVVGQLIQGGTLTVTASGDALAPGDSFDLFDALTFSGAFTNLVLPTLPENMAWNTYNLAVDGTVTVISTVGPPVVLQQPASITNVVGAAQTFSVLVAGATPFTFQWLKDGAPIADATNAALSFPYLRITNAGTYSLLVTNSAGDTVSSNATLTVLSFPPGIATQPASATRRAGQSWTVSLVATGSPALAWQWFKDGSPLADATNTSHVLNSLTAEQAGDYLAVVTNEFGSVTSAVARLDVVVAPPSIAYFGAVEGNEVIAWRTAATNKTMDVSGDNIYGSWGAVHWAVSSTGQQATNSSLPGWALVSEYSGAHYRNSGYTLIDQLNSPATRSLAGIGAVQSPGTLTFELTGQPSDYAGKVIRVGVMADVLASSEWAADMFKGYYIQWTSDSSVNSGIIPLRAGGAGNGVPEFYFFDIAGAVPGDRFTLITHNTVGGAQTQSGYAGSITWDVGTLAPRIVRQPTGVTNYAGAPASLSVITFGSQPMFYQWFKDSSPVPDATNAALAFTSLTPSDAGTYSVVASNALGTATSSDAALAVLSDPPSITAQPLPAAALVGQSASFSVAAVGALPMTYQWYQNAAPVPDATNATLLLTNLVQTNAGSFHVSVANAYGSTNSDPALLTVITENGGAISNRPAFEWLPQENLTLADAVVRFNEIMYHPPGNNPALQWIELVNVMNVDVDVSGWEIDGGVHFTFPGNSVIAGGGYVIVASDVAAFTNANGAMTVFGPFTGNLANEGERLVLQNHAGRMLDEMTYRDEQPWPPGADGSGAALAKRASMTSSSEPRHWAASPQLGGTPGRANFPVATAAPALRPLLGFYDFNASANDSSGNNLHGTASNAVLTTGGGGYEGECYSFNGVNAYVQSAVNMNASVFPQLTIGAWIDATTINNPARHCIISGDNGGYDRGLTIDSRNGTTETGVARYSAFGGDTVGVVAGGAAAIADSWVFLAVVYDQNAGTTTVYVDGQVFNGVAAHSASLNILRIGNNPSYGEYFAGKIDNAFVFRKALTPAQISSIRSGGASAILALGNQLWLDEQTGGASAFTVPELAFNELDTATNSPFRVELHNHGLTPLALTHFALTGSTYGATNFPLPDVTLSPGSFLVLDETQFGWHPGQNDKLFLLTSNATVLVDAVKVKNTPRARQPDGTGRWDRPTLLTLGTNNLVEVNRDVVINEIMYHHAPGYISNLYAGSPEEWIELFNRGTNPVDLTGWRLDGGIHFDFPSNTTLAPAGYLVVAKDVAAMQAAHPGITVLGSFTGQLANGSDLIELKDAAGNIANEVRYHDSGRWPGYADGGGSSLELVDPYADNRRAESWAASDETARGAWQTITYRGVATGNPGYDVGYNIWNEFNLGLLDAGEFLLDDVSVLELPGTPQERQLIQNGSFESDAPGTMPARWRITGNHGLHGRSVVEADPANPGNKALHVVATGPTDLLHNHLETTLKNSGSIVSVVAGREYEISFRIRWLGGASLVNSRLYANWLQRTTALNTPANSGTPGVVNSRRIANAGPTYSRLTHSPVIPPAGSNVTVTVNAYDPQTVASMTLFWRVDGGSWNSAAMSGTGGGTFAGTIPGQAASTKVQFYIRGTDALGGVSTFPAAAAASRAMLAFNDDQAAYAPMHNLRFIMAAADTALLYADTNRMSNERFGGTVIYNETEVYYDVGVRLKASAYGRTHDTETGLSIDFAPDRLFRDAHSSISVERSGNKREILAKHLFNQAGRGVASGYDDVARIITPRLSDIGIGLLSMTRTTDTFLETQYGEGGTVYNFELLYTPTSTTTGDPEGPKLNFPYSHISGEPDLQNLGSDEEAYRWNFQLRNNRPQDDFSPMIAAVQSLELNGAAMDTATRATMDVEQVLRCYAMMSLVGNDDVYTRLWNHNLRFYQRLPDNHLVAIPWDLDRTFNLATTATLWGAGANNAGNTNRLRKLIEYPANLRAYYGHMLDMIGLCYSSAYATRWANHYAAITGDSALRNYPAYIASRAAYVQSQIPASVPFAITTPNNTVVSNATVTLDGNGWVDVSEIRLGGVPLAITWTGFSNWRVMAPVPFGTNALMLQAYNRAGAVVGSANVTIINLLPPSPLAAWLRITEIMYNPTNPPAGSTNTGADFEFIELKNVGLLPLDLTGVAFTNGIDFLFAGPAITNLAPGAFVLLVHNRDAFATRYVTNGLLIAGEYTNKLSDAGERIALITPDAQLIHDFSYDGGWYPTADALGFSLVIRSETAPEWKWNRRSGWRASTEAGGSPGADDPSPVVPEILVNEVMARPILPARDSIELFNPYSTNVNIGGWFLTDDRKSPTKYRIPDGTLIAPSGYAVFTDLQFPFGLSSGGEQAFVFSSDTAGNLTGWSDGFSFGASAAGDSFGRYLTSDDVDYPRQTATTFGTNNAGPSIGPVVISEIMYAPSNHIEFVELRNLSLATVKLYDTAVPTRTWKITGLNFVFPTGTEIAGCSTLLVTTTNEPAFRAAHVSASNATVIVAGSSVLSDNGENLELQKPDGANYVTVDQVRYNDRAPWDTNALRSSLSLHRIPVTAYGNEPTNWLAAAPTPGTTAPAISAEPQSQFGYVGDNVSFSVGVCDNFSLAYQWRFNGTPLPQGTNATLALPNVQRADAGGYDVTVTSPAGITHSLTAFLALGNRIPSVLNVGLGAVENQSTSAPLSKLLTGASDPDNDVLVVTNVSAASTNGGTIEVTAGVLTYTPPSNYVGTDAFAFTVADGYGGSNGAFVVVSIAPSNAVSLNIVSPPTMVNNEFHVRFAGIPGWTYTVQTATNVSGPWGFFTNLAAGPNGLFDLTATNDPPVPARYFRTVSP